MWIFFLRLKLGNEGGNYSGSVSLTKENSTWITRQGKERLHYKKKRYSWVTDLFTGLRRKKKEKA